MGVVVLTAVCGLALALAAASVVRWGRVDRPPRPQPGSGREAVLQLARTATIGVVGGLAAGVLIGGLGSRLVMRALAATSGDGAQGLLTDADEVVGRVSAGGTIGLVIFVGVIGGVVGGLLYVMLRRWLPHRVWVGGLAFGLLLLVCLARLDPLSPDNHDFAILRPAWLAVLLVAALFPAFGVTVAALVERLDRSWPRHPAALAPLLLLVPVPPVALAGVLIGALILAARRFHVHLGHRVGQGALAVVGAAGLAWTGAGIASILA